MTLSLFHFFMFSSFIRSCFHVFGYEHLAPVAPGLSGFCRGKPAGAWRIILLIVSGCLWNSSISFNYVFSTLQFFPSASCSAFDINGVPRSPSPGAHARALWSCLPRTCQKPRGERKHRRQQRWIQRVNCQARCLWSKPFMCPFLRKVPTT